MAVKMTVRGGKKTARRMKARATAMQQTEVANKQAAVTIDRWVQKNFEREGGMHRDSNLKWPALSRATLARRRSGSGKILQDTGRLKGSFQITANKKYGRVENRVHYSTVHEFGKGRIPQRKIFPSEEQAYEIVMPVYQRFYGNAVNVSIV